MKYLAILKDSLYETSDFKVFYVLLALSVFLTLVCASFTFHRHPIEEVLTKNLGSEAKVVNVQQQERGFFSPNAAYRVTVEPLATSSGDIKKQFEVGAKRNYQERDRRVRELRLRMMIEEARGEVNARDVFSLASVPPRVLSSDWDKLLEEYFLSVSGVRQVSFPEGVDAQPSSHRIVADLQVNWAEMRHSHRMGLLFGVWKFELEEQPMGEAVTGWIQSPLVTWIAGWAGIIIAVVVSAGFVPNMLRKGTVDFLIVKPINRPTLLIYKYLGGLSFVFLNALVLIGGTWIAFGVTTSNWSPWYLSSILILTFHFAILYAFSVLLGVLTRSSLTSILVTIGLWFILFLINQAFSLVHLPVMQKRIEENASWVIPLVDSVYYVLPKPSTLSQLNNALLMQSYGSEEMLQLQREAISKISWSDTLSTSLAFIAVMLGLACWRFSRRDY